MTNRKTYITAAILLLFMFFLALFSIKNDTFTFDEVAHVTAGYSYLTQKEMRLNPEHPPLIKDIAAIPLLFLHLNFPINNDCWVQKEAAPWWFQFDCGFAFLYKSNNNPDQILFWSKLPMILMMILLGWFIFKVAKELFGDRTALLSLFFYSFSPTFLAHGRLVTTDVGAALGAFVALYYFVRFLKDSSKKNLIYSGISLGIAELMKFSLFMLYPIFVIIIFFWALTKSSEVKSFFKIFGIYLLRFILIGIVSLLVIYPVYQYHVWNYSPERQARDIEATLSTHPIQILKKILPPLAKIPVLRAFAQYFLGVSMVFQRAQGGNTTFFLGDISASGWYRYFPVVYLIKEPLAFFVLAAISLLSLSFLIDKSFWKNTAYNSLNWLRAHFIEFSMLIFMAIYWTFSIASPLNIGVRHLLPLFPFTIVLVSEITDIWLKRPPIRLKYLVLGLLMIWQVVTVIKVYPSFLAYFNELAGGPDGGYRYTVDSNLDWGQDLKRLKEWVDNNKIEKIYLDYFGGGDASYYLKQKFAPWWGTRDPKELPKGSYLAVSVSLLQGGRGELVPGFDQACCYYRWLYLYEPPVAKIGHSIFVYHIK
jgi:hypothetical protein